MAVMASSKKILIFNCVKPGTKRQWKGYLWYSDPFHCLLVLVYCDATKWRHFSLKASAVAMKKKIDLVMKTAKEKAVESR